MIDSEPDYVKYSFDQLLDVASHINREAYPDRAARLDAEIARRRAASVSCKDQGRPSPALPTWLVIVLVCGGLIIVMPIILMFIVSAGMSRGFAARDQVAESVGYFSFDRPDHVVARLTARHGSSWEFDFIDPDAVPRLGEQNVTVTFVNLAPHTIYATWQEPDPTGFSVNNREIALRNGERVKFWSGKYGKYHDARTQLRFVDKSKLRKWYDVEIALQFGNAVPAGVSIKPYVNTPVI